MPDIVPDLAHDLDRLAGRIGEIPVLVALSRNTGHVSPQPIVMTRRPQRLATVPKVIADPTRLRLLSPVAGKPDGEACIGDLTAPVGLSPPTVSHDMKVLVDAGLLEREQRGKWAYYRIVPGAPDTLGRLVSTVVGQ